MDPFSGKGGKFDGKLIDRAEPVADKIRFFWTEKAASSSHHLADLRSCSWR